MSPSFSCNAFLQSIKQSLRTLAQFIIVMEIAWLYLAPHSIMEKAVRANTAAPPPDTVLILILPHIVSNIVGFYYFAHSLDFVGLFRSRIHNVFTCWRLHALRLLHRLLGKRSPARMSSLPNDMSTSSGSQLVSTIATIGYPTYVLPRRRCVLAWSMTNSALGSVHVANTPPQNAQALLFMPNPGLPSWAAPPERASVSSLLAASAVEFCRATFELVRAAKPACLHTSFRNAQLRYVRFLALVLVPTKGPYRLQQQRI